MLCILNRVVEFSIRLRMVIVI